MREVKIKMLYEALPRYSKEEAPPNIGMKESQQFLIDFKTKFCSFSLSKTDLAKEIEIIVNNNAIQSELLNGFTNVVKSQISDMAEVGMAIPFIINDIAGRNDTT